MSLIASYCSVNPQYLHLLSIFLHAFFEGSPFVCQCSSFVLLTVRPLNRLPRTPRKTQVVAPGLVRSGICQLPNIEFGVSLIIRASAVFRSSQRGRVILCFNEVSTISKYNCHCISYNLILSFPNNLEMTSYPFSVSLGFTGASSVVRFSGRTVRSTNEWGTH